MTSIQTSYRSSSPSQGSLLQIAAGTELRCTRGSLLLRASGMTRTLAIGQALHIAQDQWVSIETGADGRFSLEAAPLAATRQAQKNRQGLGGLWRLLAARLMVRRGPRAA